MPFITSMGITIPSVTVSQMREIDQIAVEETGPNIYQMMENAGRNLAELAIETAGSNWREKKIAVLAGNGNNGGGGICAARHLANHGGNISVLSTSKNNIDSIRSYQLKILKSTNAKFVDYNELKNNSYDLIIDAVIGYGLKGAAKGEALELIKIINNSNSKILSLDVPSGIDGDSGSATSEFVNTDITMTLALPKTGLKSSAVGELYLADIGIPKETFVRAGIDYKSPFAGNYRIPINWE